MVKITFIICLILFPLLPVWMFFMGCVVLMKQNRWLNIQLKNKK